MISPYSGCLEKRTEKVGHLVNCLEFEVTREEGSSKHSESIGDCGRIDVIEDEGASRERC